MVIFHLILFTLKSWITVEICLSNSEHFKAIVSGIRPSPGLSPHTLSLQLGGPWVIPPSLRHFWLTLSDALTKSMIWQLLTVVKIGQHPHHHTGQSQPYPFNKIVVIINMSNIEHLLCKCLEISCRLIKKMSLLLKSKFLLRVTTFAASTVTE